MGSKVGENISYLIAITPNKHRNAAYEMTRLFHHQQCILRVQNCHWDIVKIQGEEVITRQSACSAAP